MQERKHSSLCTVVVCFTTVMITSRRSPTCYAATTATCAKKRGRLHVNRRGCLGACAPICQNWRRGSGLIRANHGTPMTNTPDSPAGKLGRLECNHNQAPTSTNTRVRWGAQENHHKPNRNDSQGMLYRYNGVVCSSARTSAHPARRTTHKGCCLKQAAPPTHKPR